MLFLVLYRIDRIQPMTMSFWIYGSSSKSKQLQWSSILFFSAGRITGAWLTIGNSNPSPPITTHKTAKQRKAHGVVRNLSSRLGIYPAADGNSCLPTANSCCQSAPQKAHISPHHLDQTVKIPFMVRTNGNMMRDLRASTECEH